MKLLYLSISSILYVLSFSPFDYKVLIFFSLILLFYSLENLSIKDKIKAVIYFMLLCHLLGTSWINNSLINYGSLGYVISSTITFLFALIISLPYLLIGLYKSVSLFLPMLRCVALCIGGILKINIVWWLPMAPHRAQSKWNHIRFCLSFYGKFCSQLFCDPHFIIFL